MNLEFIKPQNLGSLLLKSSQSNFILRSPGSYLVISNYYCNKVYIPCSPPAQSWRSVFTSCEIFSLHKSLAVFVFRYWSFFTAILFLTSFWNSLLALLEVRPQPDTTTFSPLLRSSIFFPFYCPVHVIWTGHRMLKLVLNVK